MGKILTIEEIKKHVTTVAKANNLKKVTLFGSYANGNATEDSDIDLLVEFKELPSFFELFDVENKIEGLTGKRVEVLRSPISSGSFLEINKEVTLYGQSRQASYA